MSLAPQKRALVSVSDKSQLGPFVKGLVELGFEIVSTGGTSRFLKDLGIAVVDVSTYTGFPEIMDGRVKTLHPLVHGAILGRPNLPADAAAIREHGIVPFQLVVCNLYPFEQTVAQKGISVDEAIEQIDIGGPSMVRSAAKNHAYVGIVTHSSQYGRVLEALREGELPLAFRRELMLAAIEMTARYDRAIADYFGNLDVAPEERRFPAHLTLSFSQRARLRYGENPHQQAAFYVEPRPTPASLAAADVLHGKELSYNNLLDLDAALGIVREFRQPCAVVIKHNNPCGCAAADRLVDAMTGAYAGDPVSAFGSVLGFNRNIDIATAEFLCEPNRFIEAIIAPGYDEAALALLTTKPKWRNNVRLLKCAGLNDPQATTLEYRRITGGLLVQERDDQPDPQTEWKVVTRRNPTESELKDLQFAWKVCKHVKSNAILLAKQGQVIGVGAGQMSRLDSSRIAAEKAGERSRGAVVASDAFFPFRDGVDTVAGSGITAIIQPGGSKGDVEVIAAADEHGLAMIFTGRRHFRH